MLTKETILKEHTKEYRHIRILNNAVIDSAVIDSAENSILEAMEQYAKQEALAFEMWKKEHGWVMDYRESRDHTNDEYWYEYQQSKVKNSPQCTKL